MGCRALNKRLLLLLAALWLGGAVAAGADEESDWLKALNDNSAEPGLQALAVYPADNSRQAVAAVEADCLEASSPSALRVHASTLLKGGEVDAAIESVEKAIELQPDDAGGRQIYAEALEQKLKSEIGRDPHTFNLCLKQWYFVYRNSGSSDTANLADRHLKDLTGKSPSVWPTAKMYFSRVLVPETGSSDDSQAACQEPTQIR
jgi:hypothetical protein